MNQQITDIEPEQDQLAVVVASSPLEKTKAQQLKEIFMPYLDKMSEVEKKIKLINTENPGKEDIAIARQIRLALKDNRVAAEKMKDDKKASILIEGRLIDSLYGVINNTSKGLELQLQNIEKAAEIAEIKRKQALAIERSELLNVYEIDLTGYDLGEMSDTTFAQLLENTKIGHEKRLEDKRKEEELRIQREANERLHKEREQELKPFWSILHDDFDTVDLHKFTPAEWASVVEFYKGKQAEIIKEQLRVKEQNERLKKEVEAIALALKEKQDLQSKRFSALKTYSAFTDADLTLLSDLTTEAFDAILFDAQALFNKEKQEREADQLKQQQQREADQKEVARIAAELKEKQDKEAAEIAAKKKAELAPDKEKLLVLASELDAYQLPALATAEATIIINSIRELLNKTSAYIRQKAEGL